MNRVPSGCSPSNVSTNLQAAPFCQIRSLRQALGFPLHCLNAPSQVVRFSLEFGRLGMRIKIHFVIQCKNSPFAAILSINTQRSF